MKLKFSIIIIFLLSFINVEAVSFEYKNYEFDSIEYICRNESTFTQNAIELRYRTSNSLGNEITNINNYFSNTKFKKYLQNENSIYFKNKDCEIQVVLWENFKYTCADVVVMNNNSVYRVGDLKKIIINLIDNKAKDIEYYYLYKGKVDCKEESELKVKLDDITKNTRLDKVDMLEINNGYTGTGYINDSMKINYAITKYDTGSYILIASPIIFTTY